ncbi:MAG: hypothetical protein NTY69_07460 [Methylococcales bacterium]|nr:hypothetical protein [Methylococcales bacterium]
MLTYVLLMCGIVPLERGLDYRNLIKVEGLEGSIIVNALIARA